MYGNRKVRVPFCTVVLLVLILLVAGCDDGKNGGKGEEASEWPSGNIELISSMAPGGGVDTSLRGLQGYLSKELGVPVIVDNMPGAGTRISLDYLFGADPDGYTFLGTNFQDMAISEVVHETHHHADEVVYIDTFNVDPYTVVVHADSPYKTFEDLYKAAQEKPLSCAVIGAGSYCHLHGILLKEQGGMDLSFVPQDGGGPVCAAVAGGHVDMGLSGLAPTEAVLEEGNIRLLAVSMGERFITLPDVPAVKETIKDFSGGPYMLGILAPPGTPDGIRDKMEAAVQKIYANPDFKKWADEAELTITSLGGAEAKKRTLADRELLKKYKDLLQEAVK